MPSHISDRNPGTLIAIDGRVIDVSRGMAELVVEYADGVPKSTLDRIEPVCRCSSAIALTLSRGVLTGGLEMQCFVFTDTDQPSTKLVASARSTRNHEP